MSKYIHDLVANMTMREKGYFKVSSSAKGNAEKNYLLLFDYVEKTREYNKANAEAFFNHLPIGKYLSSEYNYLAEQLMKSLVNFHFNKSDINKIQKLILFINIYIKKGLKKKALSVLNHTKKIAYQNEYFTQVLTLIDLEEDLLFRQGILGFTEKLNDLEIERQNLIDKINNFNKLRLLREQIRELWFQEGFFDHEPNDHPILNHQLITSEQKALSIRAKEHWLYVVAMKAYILNDHKNAIGKFKEAIEFVESNYSLFKEETLLVLISNYLYNCGLAKDPISFEKALKKLNALPNSSYVKYVRYSRTMELNYQLKMDKNHALEQEVFQFIDDNKNNLQLTQSNYIYFLLIRNSIISRNFERAQDYLNFWLNLKVINYYYFYIKLFTLIIYLELNYDFLLGFEIESSYKLLKSRKQYNDTAKRMISFFKKVRRSPNKELQLLNKLESDLMIQQYNFKYFNFLFWVEGRKQSITS